MPGVFPEISNGGVIVRDLAGNATGTAGVANAYVPPDTFTMSCPETLFGSDCTVTRWRPELHNAIVSELLAFAFLLNPTGSWVCSNLNNIAVNFEAWMNGTATGTLGDLVAKTFKTCAGATHVPGALVPTCAEMTAAIANAIAALPADKFLQGLSAYDATTNTMTLLMSDGSTVPVDLTGLIADALDDLQYAVYATDLQGAGVAGQESGASKIMTVATLAPVVRFDDTNLINGFGFGASQDATGTSVMGYGYQAAKDNTGSNVEGYGYQAAATNTGSNVEAFGYVAAQNNSGDTVNAYGYSAARNNTGDNVHAYGYVAARDNTGSNVDAFGPYAAQQNTGSTVEAWGYSAAMVNAGAQVDAYGYSAARNNTASFVEAYGYFAGQANTGAECMAYGRLAGQNNTGTRLHAYGEAAARNNTGIDVMAYGYQAAQNNQGATVDAYGPLAASSNTGAIVSAFGRFAAQLNTGTRVGAFGYGALQNNTANDVTGLGRNAGQFNTFANVTLLGHGSVALAPNQAVVGNSSQTPVGYAAFLNISDARDKIAVPERDITKRGLEFVLALEPVSYRYDHRDRYFDTVTRTREVAVEEEVDGKVVKRTIKEEYETQVPRPRDGSRADALVRFGFMAQQVKAAAEGLGIDFHGVRDLAAEGGVDKLLFEETSLIPDLVLAVKALKAESDALRAEIKKLKAAR